MYRFITSLFLMLILGGSLIAQEGHKIEFDIDGYKSDTLIIGFYYGKSQRVLDTLLNPKRNGKFVLQGEDTLKHGTYLALVKPENTFYQFMVDEDQTFKLKNSAAELNEMKVKGSDENIRFFNYLHFLKSKNEEVSELREAFKSKSTKKDSTKLNELLIGLDKEVKQEQEKIINEQASGLLGLMLKIEKSIALPTFEGSNEEVQVERYHFGKKHYFDFIDLSDDRNITMPTFDKKVNDYIDRWTPNYPDSIIQSIDYILPLMKDAKETYKYFLSSWLNKYGRSKVIGQDAIYVHLAKNYYGSGKAPWADEKTIAKILKEAKFMEPSLIGKTAANVTLFKEDSSAVKLHDIQSRFTVLFFWSPTCGHCKKSMPEIVKFQEEYAAKGVKLVAVCTKHQDDYKKCWDGVKEQNMENFLNVGDQYHRSRFKLKFNVRTTPKVFVLDADKKIVLKDFPGDKLGEVIDGLIEEEERLEKENLQD